MRDRDENGIMQICQICHMIMTLINPTLTSEVRGIWGGQRAAMRAMPFDTAPRERTGQPG